MAAGSISNSNKVFDRLLYPEVRNKKGQIPNQAHHPFLEHCIQTLKTKDPKEAIPLRKKITQLLEGPLATKKTKLMLYKILEHPSNAIDERETSCKLSDPKTGKSIEMKVSKEELAAVSTYFESITTPGGIGAKVFDATGVIEITSENPDMTALLLELLHRFSLSPSLEALGQSFLSLTDFRSLLEEARRIGVLELVRPLIEGSLSELISGDNVSDVAALVIDYQLKKVESKLVKFLFVNGDAETGKKLFKALELLPDPSAFKRLQEAAVSLICLKPIPRKERDEWLPKLKEALKNSESFTLLPNAKLSGNTLDWVLKRLPKNLEKLSLSGSSLKETTLPILTRFKDLKSLEITRAKALRSANIPVLAHLFELKIKHCPNLVDFTALKEQPALRRIFFTQMPQLTLDHLIPLSTGERRKNYTFIYPKDDLQLKFLIEGYNQAIGRETVVKSRLK